MTARNRPIDDWIARYLVEEQPKSKSLIISVFGDSIAPRTDGVWLGELIDLMAPFGVNERLVRTSSFRLIDEGWLESVRDGRRSRYTLTPQGRRRFAHAYRRIYTPPPRDWNGQWTFVVMTRAGAATPERAELRRELEWEGFGMLAPGVFAHPSIEEHLLAEILDQLGLRERAVVLGARDLPGLQARPVSALTGEYWDLGAVGAEYRRFLQRFETVPDLLPAGDSTAAATRFAVQTLLIHSFRRVSLHDPRLPEALLPADWPGHAAYALARRIYRHTFLGTQAYVSATLSDLTSPPVPDPDALQRFGSAEAD